LTRSGFYVAADSPSGSNRVEKFRHSGKFSLRIKQRF
jgi:hypothetical protein